MDDAKRTTAANAVAEALDPLFFEVCAHPARVELIRALIRRGAADVTELAAAFPQDRSVISRHLATLQRAGVLRARKEGRRIIYDLDGPAVLRRLQILTAAVSALSAICCPSSGEEGECR